MFLLGGLRGVLGQLVEHVGARRVGDVQVVGEGCAVGGGAGEWVLLVGFLCRVREGRVWCEWGAMGLGWGKLKGALQEAGSPAGMGSKVSSLWCFLGPRAGPQVFSQPQASGHTGSPHQRWDLARGGLALTVATPGEFLSGSQRGLQKQGTPLCPACLQAGPDLLWGPQAHDHEMPTLGFSAVMAGLLQVSFYAWTHLEVYTGHIAGLLVQHLVRSRCSHWHRPYRQPLLQPSAATGPQASFTDLLPPSQARAGRSLEAAKRHLHLLEA